MRTRAWVQNSQERRCRVTVLGKLFTPIVHVHQTAKLVAALLRVAMVTAGLAESNGSLPPVFTSPAGWLPRTGISSWTLRSAIEYRLPLLFYFWLFTLSQKKTICNPLAHFTWKCTTLTCEVPNFFYLTECMHCTCIFRTCVFHPCRFVLAFSVHAFSILAKCAVSYLPFPYLRFPVLAFSAPPRLLPIRDVKTFFYVFLFWSRFYVFNVFFIFQTFFLKNVGKVQSGKQINKKHFQKQQRNSVGS